MIIDPLDEALVHVISQTPILGLVIVGVGWLAQKVTRLDNKVTRIETKLDIHINAHESRNHDYETSDTTR